MNKPIPITTLAELTGIDEKHLRQRARAEGITITSSAVPAAWANTLIERIEQDRKLINNYLDIARNVAKTWNDDDCDE